MERFGGETLAVIEEEPERLSTVKGITSKRAMEISAAFRELPGLRRVMEFLARYELPVELAMRLYRTYGADALPRLRADPYLLAGERYGVAFADVDEIALSMGFGGDSPCRPEAAVLYELEHNLGNGHVFLPRPKLLAATEQLIGAPPELVEPALDTLERRPFCRANHVTFGRFVDLAIKDMNNMGAAMAPAAADTLRRHLMDTGRTAADYDLIISGDLGKIGHDLLLTLMMDAGVPLDAARYVDCGMLIFSPEQDVHAGGSGCGCSASVLCGYIMRLFREKAIHRVAFMATGALLSPTFSQQGGAIPGIAHLIVLEADEA